MEIINPKILWQSGVHKFWLDIRSFRALIYRQAAIKIYEAQCNKQRHQ